MPQFVAPSSCPPLAVLLDAIPASRRAVADHLGIKARTLTQWVAEGKAPRAAVVALFMESDYGRQTIDCALFNKAQLMTDLADCLHRETATLRARIARLEGLGNYGSANEPFMRRSK